MPDVKRANGLMSYRRALAVWVLIAALETLHGALRTQFLVPVLGDAASRRLGVFTGSMLVLLVAWATARWLGAATRVARLSIGMLWVVLTVAFEVTLGLALGLSWSRIAEDYDPARGGWMLFGLLVLLFAPEVGARLRGAAGPVMRGR